MEQIQCWLITILDKVVLATLVGLITSGIFLYILSRFRPTIDISPEIACGADTTDGRAIYRIKVINRTKAPIVDIKAQLHIFKNHQTATGEIWKSKPIALRRSDPIVIDKYDRSDRDANYAYRFVTYDDLEAIWHNDNVQFIRFRIYARHSISGFGVFAYKDYRLKRHSIKAGEFSKGDTFEIK
ncbi:hypothetical protein [Geobacter sulfurreducens]|uniref:hypothetical protein n=1 Tax=Geobacter sulfurreducens TaxID=35554 RepID=UPI0001E3428E|nr:hypothetical protein [Geobacter sulfurreducens]ADN78317.1 hypothetical protein KN400_3421 [Geobacter sulfurreducens KN400]